MDNTNLGKIAGEILTAAEVNKLLKADGNIGVGTASPVTEMHFVYDTPIMRLSDSAASTDQEVAAFIELYRGDNTNRVGFMGFGSTSNAILTIATDYAAGIIDLNTGSNTTAVRANAAQNIGIATTDIEAWSGGNAIEINDNASFVKFDGAAGSFQVIHNGYYDGAWKYKATSPAVKCVFGSGEAVFLTAASGTVDNALTWSETVKISSHANSGVLVLNPARDFTSGVIRIDSQNGNDSEVQFYENGSEIAKIYSDGTDDSLQLNADGDIDLVPTSGIIGVDAEIDLKAVSAGPGTAPSGYVTFYNDANTLRYITDTGSRFIIDSTLL